MKYSIVIHKDDNSDYGVIVPDIPGCFSAGSTYEEAIDNAFEAIECHIEGLLIDNEIVPTPKDLNSHLANNDYDGGIWAIVDIDLSQISGKAKRINITMPERLLSIIDLYTKNHEHKTRSAFLADAALSYIEQKNKKQSRKGA